MKYLLFLIACIAVVVGCSTTQQTVTEKTIFGLEVTTSAAYDAYSLAVIKGAVPTNDLPKISAAFNDFQQAVQVAVVISQNNSNALAPANLATESAAVISLIQTIETKK